MRLCRWPKGACLQYAIGDSSTCYYHSKVSDGLFERREPSRVPQAFSSEQLAIFDLLSSIGGTAFLPGVRQRGSTRSQLLLPAR